MNSKANTAGLLTRCGWPVLPATVGPLRPSDVQELLARACSDPTTARAMFEAAPEQEVCVPLGRLSRTFALHVRGHGGREALHRLTEDKGALPSSVAYELDADNEYIWFQAPELYEVSSGHLADGVNVLGEGEIVAVPPLEGYGSNAWTFDPRHSELDWPPAWLIKRIGKLRADEAADPLIAMWRRVEQAAFAHGARRHDALLAAANGMASLIAEGQLGESEGFNQLLRAAEHSGVSCERGWQHLERQIMAALSAGKRK